MTRDEDKPPSSTNKCTKAACPHKKKGCTWVFGPAEMELHLQECKFRPYRCIGSKLKILSCGWEGIHHQIEDHLREDHELGEVFSHYQESWMPFSESKSLKSLKFVEHCVADCDNLAANMAQEKCVAVSFKMLKHYLHDGKIPFRFIIKKAGKRTSSSRE